MMDKKIRGSVAVTGVGIAGLGEAAGFTELEILAHAAQAAVADAGLSMGEIDGLCTASFSRFLPGLSVAEYLGIQPAFMDSSNVGGSSYVNYLLTAALALNAGLCNAVLVVYGSTARTQRDFREHIRARGQLEPQRYEAPYNLSIRRRRTRLPQPVICMSSVRPGSNLRRLLFLRVSGHSSIQKRFYAIRCLSRMCLRRR